MSQPLLAWPALLLALSPALAENWPQWRGPKNDGRSPEKGLPSEWSETKNVVWKVKLPGPGSSTPCVWGDRIFFTSMAEQDEVWLLCLDTAGQEKWRKKLGSGTVKSLPGEGGNIASASPSTDGKLVFAQVGSGKLAAFDFDGNERWALDLQEKYGKFEIQFGTHWTPALHKGRLYVTPLHRAFHQILCLDAATGNEVWRAERKTDSPPRVESPDVYASPFVWEDGDKAALIVHGDDYCTAHSLTDGKELWRVTELNPKANYNRAWRAVSSPLVTPKLIVVPSCKSGVTVGVEPHVAKGEIGPGATANGELWRIPRGTPDVPCPLLVDDVVYLWREKESLTAYDAKTGKQTGELKLTNERHRASPVYADGKVIALGREGNMFTVKPGREPEVIAKMKLPDVFTASPAVSGGRIYLRGWTHLWAIGTK
jgi:outer membrane protein assembly factor BamB